MKIRQINQKVLEQKVQKVTVPIHRDGGTLGVIRAIRSTFGMMFFSAQDPVFTETLVDGDKWVEALVVHVTQWINIGDQRDLMLIYPMPIELSLPIGKDFNLVLYHPEIILEGGVMN